MASTLELGDKSSEKKHLKLKKKKKKNKTKLLNSGNVVVEEKSTPATTKKKKRKHSHKNDADIATPDENSIDRKEEKKKRRKTSKKKKVTGPEVDGIDRFAAEGDDDTQKPKLDKCERAGKKKKKDQTSLVKEDSRSVACEVYCISSVDVDSTKGMKKWINEYYQQRPGLKILQQRIDDFMTSHEEKEEQARKEREALAAEGGWTVVEHHKGRKKTIEAESGTAVVSVAGAAVMDKMGKKKNKEVGVDFYRFQKREAQRNDINCPSTWDYICRTSQVVRVTKNTFEQLDVLSSMKSIRIQVYE